MKIRIGIPTIPLMGKTPQLPPFFIILLTIILVAILCYAFLRLAPLISQKMGATTMSSFNRIMGFILLCIGVQYIVNGVMPLLKTAFSS